MSKEPSAWKIEQAIATWQAARARLLHEDGELAHDENALAELLGDEAGDVRDILARLLRAAVHAETMASAAGDMIENLKGRQGRYKRRSDAMRATAFALMDVMETTKEEWPDMTVTIRKGRESAAILDEDAIPDLYAEVITTRKIDKATILSVLKSGGEVPGAALANTMPTLAIKVT